MPLAAPASVNKDHQELQRLLVSVQHLSGKTGAVAEGLADPLQAHMEKEENLALPLLGILAELVEGKLTMGQAFRAARLYSKMKEEYPGMLRGHREIRKQLSRLKKIGADEGHLTAVRFAEALEQHSQQEEEVLYPAALLAGKLASATQKKAAGRVR